METGAKHGHLGIKNIQQAIVGEAPPQELGPLAQQAAVLAQQGAVQRLQLAHHPIQPLPSQGRFSSHQSHVQSTEAHAAQAPLQIQLPLQKLSIAQGLAATNTPQVELQVVSFHR
jgi:hypothetical protein